MQGELRPMRHEACPDPSTGRRRRRAEARCSRRSVQDIVLRTLARPVRGVAIARELVAIAREVVARNVCHTFHTFSYFMARLGHTSRATMAAEVSHGKAIATSLRHVRESS